jgi:uncharacterized protein YbjT (DUF2867 family)
MYLIAGATGLVGSTVARGLRERGAAVRALLRGDPARASFEPLARAGVQATSGDLTLPETLEEACAGVTTIVCTATSMPAAGGDALQRVDHAGVLALIEAAERARVRRFVYVSYSGGITFASPFASAKRACEARLQRSSMTTVVLRPSFFMQVWLGPHLGFDAANARARIYGDGTAPVRYVSAFDVAAFATAAAMRRETSNDVVEIGGTRAVTQVEVVQVFERLLGRSFTLDHVPTAALESQYKSEDPLQKTLASLMLAVATGDAVPAALASAERYGVSLTSIEDFAKSAVAASH